MASNQQLIYTFYQSFKNKDYKAMQNCYADEAVFNDEVFVNLNAVVNRIKANFIFANGKIVRHTDNFNFYNWACQALGITGILLGWTSLVKNKVRKEGMKNLMDYIRA